MFSIIRRVKTQKTTQNKLVLKLLNSIFCYKNLVITLHLLNLTKFKLYHEKNSWMHRYHYCNNCGL